MEYFERRAELGWAKSGTGRGRGGGRSRSKEIDKEKQNNNVHVAKLTISDEVDIAHRRRLSL